MYIEKRKVDLDQYTETEGTKLLVNHVMPV